jgi:hypothetical protein
MPIREVRTVPQLVRALHDGSPVVSAELRPPRAELDAAAGMDAWIDTYHAVSGLVRAGTYVFLTDSAVGAKEENNLRHLVINLGTDVPRDRVVPFLTTKHTMDFCLSYAERAWQQGFTSLVVLGGDRTIGPPRCVSHAWQLREDAIVVYPDRTGEITQPRTGKTIRVPSGDHDGLPSIWSPCVRRFIAFPSGATAKICGNPPGRVLENAIRVPSGDHDGDRSSAVLLPPSVNCRSSVPSAFITKSRNGPPGSVRLAYTICVPSGDQAGSRSARALCVRAPPPLPSARPPRCGIGSPACATSSG